MHARAHAEIDDDPALTDPLELLARVLIHIPEPRKHLVHFLRRLRQPRPLLLPKHHAYRSTTPTDPDEQDPPPRRRGLSKRWAELIYRVFEVDPLTCPCGAQMDILAFIVEPREIRRILRHLDRPHASSRALPHSSTGH